jgi:hypothetical protein
LSQFSDGARRVSLNGGRHAGGELVAALGQSEQVAPYDLIVEAGRDGAQYAGLLAQGFNSRHSFSPILGTASAMKAFLGPVTAFLEPEAFRPGIALMDDRPELKAMARECRAVADKIEDSSNRRSVLDAAATLDRMADESADPVESERDAWIESSTAVPQPWQLKKRLQP